MIGKKHAMRKRRAQSRTRRLYRGGAVAVLPNVERIATAKQPIVGTRKKSRIDMFNDEYDVFFIAAHGALLEGSNYDVPPDTYISNLSASGCELVHDEKLERKFYLMGNDNNMNTSYEADFWEYLTTPRYNIKTKPNNNSNKPTTSIYEPGDSVPDNTLSFLNTNFFGGVGIFKVPISVYVLNTKKALEKRFNKAFTTFREKGLIQFTPEGLPIFTQELREILDALSVQFIITKGNLIQPILKRRPSGPNSFKFTLSELLKEPELQPTEGKKRLIILQTCRGLAVKPNTITLKKIRRSSLNRRKYTMLPAAGAAAAPEAAGGKANSPV